MKNDIHDLIYPAGLIAAVYVVASLFSPNAHAVDLEVGLGQTRYDCMSHGDGIWQQTYFAHSTDCNDPAYLIGVTGNADEYAPTDGMKWHIDYVYLGKVKNWSIITPDDYNYRSDVGRLDTSKALVNMYGRGSVQGVAFTLAPYKKFGEYEVSLEAGPYIHKPKWDVNVPDYCEVTGDPTFNSEYRHNPKIQPGAVVGAGITKGDWTLTWKIYFVQTSGDMYTGIWKRPTNIMLIKKF